ncbi:MAG: helix-turn-helix transcriptional regulator, partial [Arthrobacter sp.]
VAPEDSGTLETARNAIRTGAQLRLSYLSPQRDAVTERDIDPQRLYSLDSTWYLEAYCHSAHGLRNFRLDRVQEVRPNGRPAATHGPPAGGVPAKLFTANDDDTTVTVQLTRQGRGLAEDYYAERTAELPDGGLVAEIRFGNTAWLPMFVAQQGGMVRILAPNGLADAAREWLSASLDRYAG